MDGLLSKAKKFYQVATSQGLGNALQLATQGYIDPSDKPTHSSNRVEFGETTEEWNKVQDWLESGPGHYEDNMPGYTDDQVNTIHANRYKAHGEYEVWDDDNFVWRSVTEEERNRDVPIKGMDMMTPTRPGSYYYKDTNVHGHSWDEEYQDLKVKKNDSIWETEPASGGWLTPDPSGAGLIMADERQPTSVDQFKRIWGSGDPVEGQFTNEQLYNLLFEDKEGDVSIVKALDRLYNWDAYYQGGPVIGSPLADEWEPLPKSTNEAVLRAIEALNPENIYYMDAGMNQDFFYNEDIPESFWGDLIGPGIEEGYFPYTHTGGLIGKKLD